MKRMIKKSTKKVNSEYQRPTKPQTTRKLGSGCKSCSGRK